MAQRKLFRSVGFIVARAGCETPRCARSDRSVIARALGSGTDQVLSPLADRANPEEPRAAPGGTGDGACDGRKACISDVAPHVSVADNRNRVPLALVFPDQDGARSETPGAVRSRFVASGKAIEKLGGTLIETAEGLFLDMPANKPGHEVFGEGRRRRRSEC